MSIILHGTEINGDIAETNECKDTMKAYFCYRHTLL